MTRAVVGRAATRRCPKCLTPGVYDHEGGEESQDPRNHRFWSSAYGEITHSPTVREDSDQPDRPSPTRDLRSHSAIFGRAPYCHIARSTNGAGGLVSDVRPALDAVLKEGAGELGI